MCVAACEKRETEWNSFKSHNRVPCSTPPYFTMLRKHRLTFLSFDASSRRRCASKRGTLRPQLYCFRKRDACSDRDCNSSVPSKFYPRFSTKGTFIFYTLFPRLHIIAVTIVTPIRFNLISSIIQTQCCGSMRLKSFAD